MITTRICKYGTRHRRLGLLLAVPLCWQGLTAELLIVLQFAQEVRPQMLPLGDLSATLSLSPLEGYEGGTLVIEDQFGPCTNPPTIGRYRALSGIIAAPCQTARKG